MITFSEKIKTELIQNNYTSKQLTAILQSYFINNVEEVIYNNKTQWNISTQFNKIILFLNRSLHKLYKVDMYNEYSNISNFNKRRTYRIIINKPYETINRFLHIDHDVSKLKNQSLNKEFVIGAFLSAGSISSLNNSKYHLEITSLKLDYLRHLQTILVSLNFYPVIIKRRSRWVLYIKKMLEISDFLKFIGATEAMLEFEDKILSRDYYTNLKRANNLDLANLNKLTQANLQQIKMIQKVSHTLKYKKQCDKFKFFCSIRLKYPQHSLKQLVTIFKNEYGVIITKAGINYYVRVLRNLAK
ncbi:MAG: DNA-binding protein WhiA [Mycoplasmataceae bacterium]|nr:DNA-binding protein WhiA [Mycoplasmataceae bacterium]